MYSNGQEVATADAIIESWYSSTDGRIVIGRYFTNADEKYASIEVDELVFFNQALTSTEINQLNDWV